MQKYIVRAADCDFVEKEEFEDLDEAIRYEQKMIDIFGRGNVELYEV